MRSLTDFALKTHWLCRHFYIFSFFFFFNNFVEYRFFCTFTVQRTLSYTYRTAKIPLRAPGSHREIESRLSCGKLIWCVTFGLTIAVHLLFSLVFTINDIIASRGRRGTSRAYIIIFPSPTNCARIPIEQPLVAAVAHCT